jgi:hypothetical protein
MGAGEVAANDHRGAALAATPIPRACMSFRRDSGILILIEQQIILPEA